MPNDELDLRDYLPAEAAIDARDAEISRLRAELDQIKGVCKENGLSIYKRQSKIDELQAELSDLRHRYNIAITQTQNFIARSALAESQRDRAVAELAETKEQLRLCIIDQATTEAKVEELEKDAARLYWLEGGNAGSIVFVDDDPEHWLVYESSEDDNPMAMEGTLRAAIDAAIAGEEGE